MMMLMMLCPSTNKWRIFVSLVYGKRYVLLGP